MKDKVILAYSGGLDTTAIIPWLKENYNYDVVCCCIDVGQEKEKRRQVEQYDPACHDECGEGNIQEELQRHTFDGRLPHCDQWSRKFRPAAPADIAGREDRQQQSGRCYHDLPEGTPEKQYGQRQEQQQRQCGGIYQRHQPQVE